jgi:hypothetical protein
MPYLRFSQKWLKIAGKGKKKVDALRAVVAYGGDGGRCAQRPLLPFVENMAPAAAPTPTFVA